MDEEKTKPSYDDLIGAGIDSLNESESFQNTSLRKVEREQPTRTIYQTWWFPVLAIAAVANLAAWVLLKEPDGASVARPQADRQAMVHFGEGFPTSLPTAPGRLSTAGDTIPAATARQINVLLSELAEGVSVPAEELTRVGDGLYWVSEPPEGGSG
ncbi:MAG: hypothetical protein KDD44_11715 [Bdellovibrionales bacterium]|nr:hypothetical protein [Bdellovibrionales bacterium]